MSVQTLFFFFEVLCSRSEDLLLKTVLGEWLSNNNNNNNNNDNNNNNNNNDNNNNNNNNNNTNDNDDNTTTNTNEELYYAQFPWSSWLNAHDNARICEVESKQVSN